MSDFYWSSIDPWHDGAYITYPRGWRIKHEASSKTVYIQFETET